MRCHRVEVQARAVNGHVQGLRLGDVLRLNGGNTALARQPIKHQTGHVNSVRGGRVVHGAVGGHGLVIEGAGANGQRVAQQVFAHHYQRQSSGPKVFLRAAKGQAHAAPVHRARGNLRRKIDHQRGVRAQSFEVGQGVEFHAVDGFVAANVDVAGAWPYLPSGGVGNVGKATGLATGGNVGAAVFAGFLPGFLAPTAGQHKVGLARLARRGAQGAQVERHDGVLGQATALHEQNLEVCGHRQQAAQRTFSVRADGHELLAAVAHFHHAHAAAFATGVRPVQHFAGRLRQHLGRHGGRTGRKVIGSGHAAGLA